MAEDNDGASKGSGLKTFLWAGVAAVAAVMAVGSGFGIAGVLYGAAALFTAGKAWGSHKQNQAIEESNIDQQEAMYNRQRLAAERAANIAQMQDQDQNASSRWQDAEAARRAYSQNVR